jgi:hypothetical protein
MCAEYLLKNYELADEKFYASPKAITDSKKNNALLKGESVQTNDTKIAKTP